MHWNRVWPPFRAWSQRTAAGVASVHVRRTGGPKKSTQLWFHRQSQPRGVAAAPHAGASCRPTGAYSGIFFRWRPRGAQGPADPRRQGRCRARAPPASFCSSSSRRSRLLRAPPAEARRCWPPRATVRREEAGWRERGRCAAPRERTCAAQSIRSTFGVGDLVSEPALYFRVVAYCSDAWAPCPIDDFLGSITKPWMCLAAVEK